MKVALYVHDLKLEIGHSNSLIELIRHLPSFYLRQVTEIEVVTFTTGQLQELFPDFQGKLTWTKVPFPKLKPFFFKSFFYQLWTIAYNKLFQSGDVLRIGIGVSSLDVHAVSVQFIHHQWTKPGLKLESDIWFRQIYKKFLFYYYEVCENYLFSKKNIKVFSPAKFLTKFLQEKYPAINAVTIYSGVNLNRFELGQEDKSTILSKLINKYPLLSGLNLKEPIYLFVGAYERKGLNECLDLLKTQKNAQFIVIGSPSMGRKPVWPENIKVFPITFTKEVPLFYALADVFIFPTIYEPFGLVLFEAMAMGLTIITRRESVGASELLEGLPDIYFTDDKNFIFPNISIKNLNERVSTRDMRLKALGDVSWNKAGDELASYLAAK